MNFADKLREIRRERNITQEQLAEILGVSRQAVSKWESGNGYPETEKLMLISKALEVSLDYLLLEDSSKEDFKVNGNSKESCNVNRYDLSPNITIPSGKIVISTSDGTNLVTCYSVKYSYFLFSSKKMLKYILYGVDKVTFWGEHSTTLGYYFNLDDVKKEISEIMEAIKNGIATYQLKYAVDFKYNFLGQAVPKN